MLSSTISSFMSQYITFLLFSPFFMRFLQSFNGNSKRRIFFCNKSQIFYHGWDEMTIEDWRGFADTKNVFESLEEFATLISSFLRHIKSFLVAASKHSVYWRQKNRRSNLEWLRRADKITTRHGCRSIKVEWSEHRVVSLILTHLLPT
jgi:hypothetical protein